MQQQVSNHGMSHLDLPKIADRQINVMRILFMPSNFKIEESINYSGNSYKGKNRNIVCGV
jgi:hypothetical protein